MMATKQLIKIYIGFFFVFLIHSLQAQQKEVIIEGAFKNWPKSRAIVLLMQTNGEFVADTIWTKNGKFKHKMKFTAPIEASLSYDPPVGAKMRKDNIRFFIDEGKISLGHSDSLQLAQVKGPSTTMDFEKFKKKVNPIKEKIVGIRIQSQHILKNGGNTADIKEMEKAYQQKIENLRSALSDFIAENPKSIIALEAIKQLDGTSYSNKDVFKMYQQLDESVKQSTTGISIAKRFHTGLKTSIGTVLEDFSSLDTNRMPLSLGDVQAKGKITLVDFWASWCKPCRMENPHLRKLYSEFHDKGFNILAVSLDRSAKDWKNAINQDQLPWYHISALKYWDEPIVKQFGINGVPDSFLLDAEGKIIGRGLRGDQLYNVVKNAFISIDSLAIDKVYKQFHKESEYEAKLAIYERLIQEPVFLERKYSNVETGGMQRTFAVAAAKKGNINDFLSWSSRMTAAVMRRIAMEEGYSELAKNMNKLEFIKLIRMPLDSLLLAQPWTNEDINLYSNLASLYVESVKESAEITTLAHYLTPYYSSQGKYFAKDINTDFQKFPKGIKESLSYNYAIALAKTGAQDEAFYVLARAVETGAFSKNELVNIKEDFSGIQDLEHRLEQYIEKAQSSYASKVETLLKKNTLTGKALDRQVLKNKYILLDFWGSWCLPCRASHPKMINLYENYRDQGLEIISVSHEAPASMEKMQEVWRAAITKDKMTWIQILNNDDIDSFDAVKEFGVASFPTKILLDKELNKIEVFTGVNGTDELTKKLNELLGNNKVN